MDIPERYEQLIAYLNSHLPEPVEQLDADDGALQFLAGDPPLVVAVLTDTSVMISEFAGVWETPFKFTAKPTLANGQLVRSSSSNSSARSFGDF